MKHEETRRQTSGINLFMTVTGVIEAGFNFLSMEGDTIITGLTWHKTPTNSCSGVITVKFDYAEKLKQIAAETAVSVLEISRIVEICQFWPTNSKDRALTEKWTGDVIKEGIEKRKTAAS